jgi:O-antigen ligase
MHWISQNQLWWTLAFGALPLFFPHKIPLFIHLFFIAILALPWGMRAFLKDEYRPNPNFDLLLFIFLLTHLPGFYTSINLPLSMEKFTQTLVGVGLAAGLLSKKRTVTDLKRILFLVILGSSFLAMVIPFITQWEWSAKILQIPGIAYLQNFRWRFGEDVNPNVVGGLMVLMLPAAIGLRIAGIQDLGWKTNYLRVVLDTCLLLITGMLLLSQARGGYIGASFALLVMSYLLGGKLRWITAGGLYSILTGILWVGPANMKTLLGGSGLVGTWDIRVELWNRAVYMIQDFPFTGVGIGLYGRVANTLYPFFQISGDTIMGHAHHLLLQVAVDLGISGLVAFTMVFGSAVGATCFCRECRLDSRIFRLGLLASLLAITVHGMFDCSLCGNKLAPAPWLFIGLIHTSCQGKSLSQVWLKRWELTTGWLLLSLGSIALVGTQPLLSLFLANGGGFILGIVSERTAFRQHSGQDRSAIC